MQLCIKAYAADWRRFMTANKGINWKRLILALVVSLGAGVISWLLTGNSMEMYTLATTLYSRNINWGIFTTRLW